MLDEVQKIISIDSTNYQPILASLKAYCLLIVSSCVPIGFSQSITSCFDLTGAFGASRECSGELYVINAQITLDTDSENAEKER